jgi:hypothetical protein
MVGRGRRVARSAGPPATFRLIASGWTTRKARRRSRLASRRAQLVVDEARTVHRLDRGADRLAVTIEPSRHGAQTISIRRGRADFDRRALNVEQMKVETLAAEI